MEASTNLTSAERGGLRAEVKSVRREWRERLSLAERLSPGSRLAKRAGVLLLDLDSLDDRIAECGGEDGFVFVVCAQVAGGCSLTDWCAHYGLHRGSVWAVLTETDERYERYKRALAGVADDYMGQVPQIALNCSLEEVPLGKFQADTLLKVAAVYDRRRFGGDKNISVQGVGVVIDAGLAFAASELLGRLVGERVVQGVTLEADTVIPAETEKPLPDSAVSDDDTLDDQDAI